MLKGFKTKEKGLGTFVETPFLALHTVKHGIKVQIDQHCDWAYKQGVASIEPIEV